MGSVQRVVAGRRVVAPTTGRIGTEVAGACLRCVDNTEDVLTMWIPRAPRGPGQGVHHLWPVRIAAVPRIRLIFLLLLILPIQFAWASATSYCRHETGQATKHFGHHEHQHHHAQDGASEDTKAVPATGADTDCGMCQLGVAQPIPATPPNIAVTGTESPRFLYGARFDSHIPRGPERPDRTAPTPAV